MGMKTWKCPKCGYTIRAMGSEAIHRCPKTKKNERLKEEDE